MFLLKHFKGKPLLVKNKEKPEEKPTYFNRLPSEVVFNILAQLPPEQLKNLEMLKGTSSNGVALADIANDNVLWKNKVECHFPEQFNNLKTQNNINWEKINWKIKFWQIYREQYANLAQPIKELFSLIKEGKLDALKKRQITINDLPEHFSSDGLTLIEWAIKKRHQELLNYFYHKIVLKYYLNTTIKDQCNRTLLYWAVLCQQSTETINQLVSQINVNEADTLGMTPLYVATYHKNTALIQALLQKNANPNLKHTKNYQTPLYLAIKNNHIEAIKILLEKNASISEAEQATTINDISLLCVAVKNNSIETLELLLKNGVDVNQATSNGFTVLHLAIKNNNIEALKLLLRNGADVNQTTTSDGLTPLHLAVKNNNIDALELLLKNGADVNQTTTSDGLTPLHLAVINNHVKALELLLENGVDGNQPTLKKFFPLHLAVEKGNLATMKILLKYKLNTHIPQQRN